MVILVVVGVVVTRSSSKAVICFKYIYDSLELEAVVDANFLIFLLFLWLHESIQNTNQSISLNGLTSFFYRITKPQVWQKTQYLFDIKQDMDSIKVQIKGDSLLVRLATAFAQQCSSNIHVDAHANRTEVEWQYVSQSLWHYLALISYTLTLISDSPPVFLKPYDHYDVCCK